MPSLLNGAVVNSSSPSNYITLKETQFALGPTPTTSTGYTVITNFGSVVSYSSSLGNIQFSSSTMYSNVVGQSLKLIGTGTTSVLVAGGTVSTSTNTGALIVQGDIAAWGTIRTGNDIFVNNLKVGQGWQGVYNNLQNNNIVITGALNTTTSGMNDGENSIAIGYNTLGGLSTALKVIAIGSNAISTGNNVSNTVAIGDNALKRIGTVIGTPISEITEISNSLGRLILTFLSGYNSDKLTSGLRVTILSAVGDNTITSLNGISFYMKALDAYTIQLYDDILLTMPTNGTGINPGTYATNSGFLCIAAVYQNNIAVGTNAASNLYDGEQNFFLGDNVAGSLTTGSFNVFIGHQIAGNIIQGSNNIAIGGYQLVDNVDNQIVIGDVINYDGNGYTQINSNLGTGLGTLATSTSFITAITTISNTNPIVIQTTASYLISTGTEIIINDVGGMTELNDQIYFTSYINSTTFALYYDLQISQPVDGTGFTSYTSGGSVIQLEPTGALSVSGGVGIAGNLIVSDDAIFYRNISVKGTIDGVISNLKGGNTGSIPYQVSPNKTNFIGIGPMNYILQSNGSTATWVSPATIVASANSSTEILISAASDGVYYPALAVNTNTFSLESVNTKLTFIVTSTNTSSYFSTGTDILNVPGSIYSVDGNPQQNYKLYTPKVIISSTAPTNPNIGDFWIDTIHGVELQYVNDGGDSFWIQFTTGL